MLCIVQVKVLQTTKKSRLHNCSNINYDIGSTSRVWLSYLHLVVCFVLVQDALIPALDDLRLAAIQATITWSIFPKLLKYIKVHIQVGFTWEWVRFMLLSIPTGYFHFKRFKLILVMTLCQFNIVSSIMFDALSISRINTQKVLLGQPNLFQFLLKYDLFWPTTQLAFATSIRYKNQCPTVPTIVVYVYDQAENLENISLIRSPPVKSSISLFD